MAYDLKNVFYLDVTAQVTKSTSGDGSAQLDLSAYIDPISKGRGKGVGLAIYKTYYSVINSDTTNMATPDASDPGILTMSLQAGLGVGDNATGALVTADTAYQTSNNLLISAGTWYSPASYPGARATVDQYIMPSKDVPYIIVRDNVCLVYTVDAAAQFADNVAVSVRLECAQVTLDQATLNQLLRTQTV